MPRSFGRTTRLAGLMLASALLFACDGSTGPAGPAGPAGTAGTPGAPGPSGPPGPSTGTALPFDSADNINVEIQSVTVPTGGGAPEVTMFLSDDLGFGLKGVAANMVGFTIAELTAGVRGSSSAWQSYITKGSTNPPNVQATTESATAGTFTDNNDGTYTYTFAQDLTAYPAGPVFDATKTHRLGVEIRTDRVLDHNIPANNAPYDFVPAGGSPVFTRLLVNNEVCNACHDKLEAHGEARFDVEYCVTCHNPYSIDPDTATEEWGGTVDMTQMIHKIHYGADLMFGYEIIGFGGRPHDFSAVEFPQDARNCTTCHDESDASIPQTSNWRTKPNRAACGACHDRIDWDGSENDPNRLHYAGLVFIDDSGCVACHGVDAEVLNGEFRVAEAHRQPDREAGEHFSYNVLSVSNTAVGEFPVIEFSVTDPLNGDTPYDILNDPAWTRCFDSRLAVGIAWDTDDYHNNNSGSTPGLPVSIDPLGGGTCFGASTDVGGGVFSVTSPVAVPANAGGSLAVIIEGHPAVDIDGAVERVAVTSAVTYAAITDAAAMPRRQTVAIEKCDECHNQLAVHGNNRTDNIEVCVTCHAPNVTDINRRVGTCATALGTDDTPVDFKVMIHALHAFGKDGVALEVCGFGFPSTPHTFDFDYPGQLNNCEGCHVEDGFYPVDPAAVLGTTVDANDPATPADDTVISPNSAVCSACHSEDLARNHMMQNGGDFAATKDADSNLISSGVETCELCHGPGGIADVKVVHHVDEFQFN